MPSRIRKGDTVMVISGKDKGATGEVIEVRPRENRVLVRGVNMMKRHTRPRPPNIPGGVIERPAPLDLSNVSLVDPKDKHPTRVRIEVRDGERVRVSSRSGEKIGG